MRLVSCYSCEAWRRLPYCEVATWNEWESYVWSYDAAAWETWRALLSPLGWLAQ